MFFEFWFYYLQGKAIHPYIYVTFMREKASIDSSYWAQGCNTDKKNFKGKPPLTSTYFDKCTSCLRFR